jgi:hypothetical protein
MPTQQDEDLRGLLRDYLHDTGGERRQVKDMFDKVLGAVSSLRAHVDNELSSVRQDVRGVSARVQILEEDRKRKPSASIFPVDPKKIEEHYTKTPTGTFRLTDFELHDLHAEANTWRSIKSFCRAAAIPVAAAVALGALVAIFAAVWHPVHISQPVAPNTMRSIPVE